MHQLLQPGDQVIAQSTGLTCQVERFLGGGGQGEVYLARLVDPNRRGSQAAVALKWFYPHYLRLDPGLEARLQAAIQRGAPSDRFLWPLELVRSPQHAGFGYLMPLREPRFVGLVDLMMRRVEPSFRALITAGFELAHSYLQLHAKGLCYRDISFTNVFFDPQTGEVRICDNDNVDIDGQTGGIGGTARFMAPEIVRGEAGPSIHTDLFSLAVLLFYMLINHHPLEGAREAAIHCFDLPAMARLYGHEPIFIFDPQDERNRPLPGYHDNALALWPIYPQFVRDLFIRAFTQGIHDPVHGRVRESEWRAALVRLRDAIFYCLDCGAENFYDLDALRARGGHPGTCWHCGAPHYLPPRLRLDRDVVLLNYDTALYPHHVDPSRVYDFSRPVAQVVQHPQDPRVWGLANRSDQPWTATDPEGGLTQVQPGQTVTLFSGLRIHFGAREGQVRF